MEKVNADNQILQFPTAEIETCIADRLKEAREARGYNASEFAEFVGLSRQSISQYEIGRIKPSTETLGKIAANLKLPLAYFTTSRPRHSKDNNIVEDNTIFFRSLEGAAKKDRDRLRRRLQWIADIFSVLSKFIDFPTVDLPATDDITKIYPQNGLNPEQRDSISKEEIEEIASILRKHWKLGKSPIHNIVALLESKGFIIVKESFYHTVTTDSAQTDALSTWIDGRPFIYLSRDKGSAVRSRFDVAHELGHLLLHSGVEITNKSILKQIECEANYFAGAFLLPRESFGREAISMTSMTHFVSLKPRWKVSIAAMIHRCHSIGSISENQNSYLWRQLNAKGWRFKEPLDDEIEESPPILLEKAVDMLFQHDVCTPSEIMEYLHLNPQDIVSICGLSSNPFDKRKEHIAELSFKRP